MNKTVYIAGMPEAEKDNRVRMEELRGILREGGYQVTGRQEKEPRQMTPKSCEMFNKLKNTSSHLQIGAIKVVRTYAKKSDIMGDVSWEIEQRIFGRDIRKSFPNSVVTAKYLSGEIEGLKYEPPETSNIKIPIVSLEKSEYKGQDMRWYETKTGEYRTDKTEIHYHYSSTPIKEFGKKQIAMVSKGRPYTDTGYAIIIPKGKKIEQFGTFETRIELDDEIEIYQLKPGWSKYKEVMRAHGMPSVVGGDKVMETLTPAKEPWQMTKAEFAKTAVPLPDRKDFIKAWLKDNEDIPDLVKPGFNYIEQRNGSLLVFGNQRGQAIGIISLRKDVVEHIAISDRYKGRGIATQLLEESRKYSVRRIIGAISPEAAGIAHRFMVKTAFMEGKPVPPEVLREYPDLMAKAEKQKWRRV